MDPIAGLDGCGKISPPPGFDPRTFQLVASRYTDEHDNGKLRCCAVVFVVIFCRIPMAGFRADVS